MLQLLKTNRNNVQHNDYFLGGIRQNDSAVIEVIFDQFRPGIRRHIRQNGGTVEDADDIFMDALEVIYRQVKTDSLTLTCAFYTYLFEICKRLWLKKLRRKKFQSGVTIDDWPVSSMGEEPKIEMETMERYRLYQDKLLQLQEDCRKILDLYLVQHKSMNEIALIMGYAGEGYARKRKHLCKERLKELIRMDRRFEELKAW